jgi:hypothetical protein
MVMDNNIIAGKINREIIWIQPSIENLDLSFYTQKIIDDIYSVVDEKVAAELDTSQIWFWADEWQKAEQKVDEYIKGGQIEEFDTIEEFLRTLRE